MMKRLFLICLAATTFIQPVMAFNYCNPAPYVVFHINGINTTLDEAQRNRDKLKDALPYTINGKDLKVHLAYNVTRGYLSDLADVYAQKSNEFPGITFVQFIASFVALTNNIGTLPAATQVVLAYIREYVSNAMANSAYVSLNDADLASVVADIRSETQGGQTVLLVPHSQGNLYANSAFAQVTNGPNALPPGSIGIMGVASPATYVAGKGSYLTSTNDLVISGLRSQYPLTLPANTWVKAAVFDMMGHNFVGIYMNPELTSRAQIVQAIQNKLLSLNTPTATAANRAIKLDFLKLSSEQWWINGSLTTVYPSASSLSLIRPDGIRVEAPLVSLYSHTTLAQDTGAIACSALAKNVVGRIEAASTDLLPGEYRLIGNSMPAKFQADLTVLANSSVSTKPISFSSAIPQEVELARIVVSQKADGNPKVELK